VRCFHASAQGGIVRLEPRVSEHGIPLVYFSEKRENVLVYLSNAVEKYCRETGFAWDGPWMKWGPYGFHADGRQIIGEYYPDALQRTYSGVSGYIYTVTDPPDAEFSIGIPDTVVSDQPVFTDSAEFIPDAYEAILQAEREGKIIIHRYEELTEQKIEWIHRTIRDEYQNVEDHPEYRHFLQGVFPWIREQKD
jgi:hypothetical protein